MAKKKNIKAIDLQKDVDSAKTRLRKTQGSHLRVEVAGTLVNGFWPGDIVEFDVNLAPGFDDYVLARLPDGSITFRQFHKETWTSPTTGQTEVTTVLTDFAGEDHYEEGVTILGTCVSMTRRFHERSDDSRYEPLQR